MAEELGYRYDQTVLDALCRTLDILVNPEKRHQALYDAQLTAQVYMRLMEEASTRQKRQ